MSFMDDLIRKRKIIIDGLKENEGDINLGIFEDFYPDEAHFIYELLQNAEDAGATEVAFELKKHECLFEHDAPHHFDEDDVRAITGIHSSSKKDKADKIGKFGVGFKSVNVYTDTPIIHSKDYSFKIIKLMLPELIEKDPNLNGKTKFIFPFNNPKKKVSEAYSEIKSGLEQLSETTLLFLNNIKKISWKLEDQSGAVFKLNHDVSHIEVLKQVNDKDVVGSHWLRFSKSVERSERISNAIEGIERQKVAIAFELELKDLKKSFDKSLPIAGQLKVKPSLRGNVSVFFPAAKETSGLRFHIHAPFIPELSRASIKNSPDNLPLFEQLAFLAASSLSAIRDLGLMSNEFFASLPHNEDQIPDRYVVIRDAILSELNSSPLLPTYQGGFAPAQNLLSGPTTMKSLFSEEDLQIIFPTRGKISWISSTGARGGDFERLVASLNVESFSQAQLISEIESRLYETTYTSWRYRNDIDGVFESWMSSKTAEWLQSFYALLYKYCVSEEDFFNLSNTRIVKLADGTMSVASKCYFFFSSNELSDHLPRVEEKIFGNYGKKEQHEEAKKFLAQIGVKEPGEIEEIELMLKSRYGTSDVSVSDSAYILDLIKLISIDHRQRRKLVPTLKSSYFIKVFTMQGDVWSLPENVYIDTAYFPTDLSAFFSNQNSIIDIYPISDFYAGIPDFEFAEFGSFTKQIGCITEFQWLYKEVSCEGNPEWARLLMAPGERYTSGINKDFALATEARELIKLKKIDAARLIWKTMCQVQSIALQAKYRKNITGGSVYAPSRLIFELAELAWVPQLNGSFVKPCETTPTNLHEGFTVDNSYEWLKAVKFGEEEFQRRSENVAKASKRKEIGFDTEEQFEDALLFAALPAHKRRAFLAANVNSYGSTELPEKSVRNPSMRHARVTEQAVNTPERKSEIRSRAVQVGYEISKDEAKNYLREQYTNSDNQSFCQICRTELPFKLLSGTYYFEAVEAVVDSTKRYREGFLCLCPNHAAAYTHINLQKNSMTELILKASTTEVEINLGGELASIYFTQVHLADLKTCLSVDEHI